MWSAQGPFVRRSIATACHDPLVVKVRSALLCVSKSGAWLLWCHSTVIWVAFKEMFSEMHTYLIIHMHNYFVLPHISLHGEISCHVQVGTLPLSSLETCLFGWKDAEIPNGASIRNLRDWKCRWYAVCQVSEIEFGSSSFHSELENRGVLEQSIQYGTSSYVRPCNSNIHGPKSWRLDFKCSNRDHHIRWLIRNIPIMESPVVNKEIRNELF